jgi:hypothetical protein
MKSARRGESASRAEVTQIGKQGFWLSLAERKLFVPFAQFPWFRGASRADISNVEWPQPHHLYWPALDIDLAVESIEHPERFPLVAK